MGARFAVELLLVRHCPNADAARRLLTESLDALGLDVAVVERVGEFPSPTIVVAGRDVVTGDVPASGVTACRLDLPTRSQIELALQSAMQSGNVDTAAPSCGVNAPTGTQ
ncbi:alkylmercury lyase [Dactylosporangium cerinum]|uniref:Alkylmercury lyase n=1 Tax=Dactylosporangium cerinum TaxID=1434730 RepID=A0ABV9WLY8_9ACTN